jgi:hypothetical protein
LGRPAEVLDRFGVFFQSALAMPAHFRGVPIRPGAFHQSATGMRSARFGHGTLSAALARGVFRGQESQKFHEFAGVREAREVSALGHGGDSHGELNTAQGLKGLDHRVQTPGFDGLLAFLVETLAAGGVCGNGADIFLQDAWLSRWLTDDLGEPSEVGRTPIGPAGVAAIVSESAGFKPELGGLESAAGLFTGPGEIPDGFIFHVGDLHRGEITRSRQAGEWPGGPAVRFDAVTGLFGKQRRRDDPAVVAFVAQIAIEPVATRTGCIDQNERCGLRVPLADELITVTLARTDGPQVDALGAMILGDIRHGNRVLVDIHSQEECARVRHG